MCSGLVSWTSPVHTNPSSNELFCSVFKKICVHTFGFVSFFACPHYNAVSVLKTLLYPRCACSKKLGARMRISIYRPAKLAQNWSHMVASVRHFGYSGSSGLAPVVSTLMTSPFSDSIVFSVHTRKQRFQKASFSNRSTLESVFEWLRLDDSRIRSKTASFSRLVSLSWIKKARDIWKKLINEK